ncbi:rhodanese-like domain-containing protein 4A, chloroplastic [Argentina anserina]|uniref:rhodanese-like domain-containing protein 4A, chloroplastic n=1 Tax=Argentina anserina TaxID=57926 RepID=UPI00217649E2|nr:rhodanese-like domain-containing protein 4A, chloroplastic [Potentilla anserina]
MTNNRSFPSPWPYPLSLSQFLLQSSPMDSLSMVLSCSSPPFQQPHLKTHKPISLPKTSLLTSQSLTSHHPHFPSIKNQLSFITTTAIALPSFASDQVSDKINLELILNSVDEFFTKYPFFVASVTFVWLVGVPVVENYFRKYKFISVLDAFKKLKEDPTVQLLDIRDRKSLKYLKSPNLRIVNKDSVQVEFDEGDEGGFVRKVLDKFGDPGNTVVCVLGNFEGISIIVAELLVKNGFKETYAIKGGVGGTKGWLESQENLLPPSMHMYPKKKVKTSKETGMNGGVVQQKEDDSNAASSSEKVVVAEKQSINNGHITKSTEAVSLVKDGSRSSSPYPNYPDLKPPSSPTPSKPRS